MYRKYVFRKYYKTWIDMQQKTYYNHQKNDLLGIYCIFKFIIFPTELASLSLKASRGGGNSRAPGGEFSPARLVFSIIFNKYLTQVIINCEQAKDNIAEHTSSPFCIGKCELSTLHKIFKNGQRLWMKTNFIFMY